MHPAASTFARYATDDPIDLVEIGARNVDCTVRPLFPERPLPRHRRPARRVRRRGRRRRHLAATRTRRPRHLRRGVEHTPDWRRIVANVPAMLRPGGRAVFMAGPGRPPHGVNIDDPLSPGHYANISVGELAEAMATAGFVDVNVCRPARGRHEGAARTRPAAVLTTLLCATRAQRGERWPPVGTVLDQLLASLGGVRSRRRCATSSTRPRPCRRTWRR